LFDQIGDQVCDDLVDILFNKVMKDTRINKFFVNIDTKALIAK